MNSLQSMVEASVAYWWRKLYCQWPELGSVPPYAAVCNRTKARLGYANLLPGGSRSGVVFSSKWLGEYPNLFEREVIPHELAHVAAWELFGDDVHGAGWHTVMLMLSLEPTLTYNPYDAT